MWTRELGMPRGAGGGDEDREELMCLGEELGVALLGVEAGDDASSKGRT